MPSPHPPALDANLGSDRESNWSGSPLLYICIHRGCTATTSSAAPHYSIRAWSPEGSIYIRILSIESLSTRGGLGLLPGLALGGRAVFISDISPRSPLRARSTTIFGWACTTSVSPSIQRCQLNAGNLAARAILITLTASTFQSMDLEVR